MLHNTKLIKYLRKKFSPSTYNKGLAGEWLVILFYAAQGYRLIERRWRGAAGEIDVIMRRGQLLTFIEVKLRSQNANEIPLTYTQQRRIKKTALQFIASNARYPKMQIRFDLVVVTTILSLKRYKNFYLTQENI